MPKLRRPDSVELYWEERGKGPLAVICQPCFSVPSALDGLASELEPDHRVVRYDTRGTGRSTRGGPYDIETDARDLIALLEELGSPGVLVGFGDALHRGIAVADARPELVTAVVSPGMAALGGQESEDRVADEGLASSPAVVGALLQLLESDYRSGLRTVIEGGNPQFTERDVHERIDEVLSYAPAEATLGRLRAWIAHDSREPARALGDRLWVLNFPGNLWFPEELAGALRRDAPEAHLEDVADGAVSRPDLTAAVVRRITASLRAHAEGLLRVQEGPGVRPQSQPLDGGN